MFDLAEGLRTSRLARATRRAMQLHSFGSLRPVVCVGVLALGVLAVAPSAHAQPDLDPCARSIETAEQLYVEQLYDDVEPQVLECVYADGALPADLQAAYRLLALTQIKQGEIEAARATVVKILGVDFTYEPDPLADLPLYVALVDVVKDQLRVEAAPEAPQGVPLLASRPPQSAEPSFASRVDVNSASAADLQAVRGIGPAIAERIVAYRAQNGPFQTVDDLDAVRGIGPTNLEAMRSALTVGYVAPRVRAGGGVAGAALPDTSPTEPTPTPEAAPAGSLINLNTATAEQLESLNGIGEVLAGRIIAYRTENGPFRSLEEVMEVRGIGPGKLEAMRGFATVD